jgi:hypothetical protein
MVTAVTVFQVLLGLLLTLGGLVKIIMPYAKYSSISGVAWSKEFKPWHIKLIGVLEVAGALGLLLPLFVPSLAMITPFAATGIALYMAGAMATHLRRSEYPHMVGNLMVFLVPALVIAYGTLVGFAV